MSAGPISTSIVPTGDVELFVRYKGEGPVALFVHGFPLDSRMWVDQLHLLAGVRQCVAPDLRGFGRSGSVAARRITMEDHASDLVDLVDFIDEGPVDLVGLSMGGYVALALMEYRPDLVRTLALVDTRSGADSEEVKQRRDDQARILLDQGRAAFAATTIGAVLAPGAPALARARVRTMIEDTPYETSVAALAGMRDRGDRSHVLDSVAVPAAVIVGEHDTVTPVAEAEQMARRIPGSTLTVVSGAGHLSPLESPGAVADALGDLWERSG